MNEEGERSEGGARMGRRAQGCQVCKEQEKTGVIWKSNGGGEVRRKTRSERGGKRQEKRGWRGDGVTGNTVGE